MRSDMKKLLVLRGRTGRSWCARGNGSVRRDRQTPADENAPKRGKMRPRVGGRTYPGENLKPLYRFLLSQVGRPWDLVYSELRACLSPRNTIDMHIMQHLWDMVEPLRPAPEASWRSLPMPVSMGWGPGLKVHPKSGLLVRSSVTRPKRPPLSRADHRDLGDNRLLLHLDAGWFCVETAEVTKAAFDVVLKCPVAETNREARRHRYGSGNLYAVRKHQLGKKALRAAGIF